MANKNDGKKQAGSPTATILAVAAAIIVLAIIFVLSLALAQPSSSNGPSPALNKMSEEGCAAVYGVAMDAECTGGLYPIAEINAGPGAKRFCCGSITNPDQAAKAPLPVALPNASTPPGASGIPEVS